jgi:5-methylcytosine-specific restriction endonuclease McrA
MSQTYISAALRRLVIERADGRCEYCLIGQTKKLIPHQVDHIIAEQHGGETTLNLLLV